MNITEGSDGVPVDLSKSVRPDNRETLTIDFSSMEPYYDRILEHTIQLRPYERKMSMLVIKRRNQIKKVQKSEEKIEFKLLKEPTFPSFPPNYPFKGTLVDKPKIRIKTDFPVTKTFVKMQLMMAVKRILASFGFSVHNLDTDSEPLQHLIYQIHDFLEKFVDLLHKINVSEPHYSSDNLWDQLETALQRIGYGGINGLYEFYLDKIEQNERLYRMCLNLKSEYEELKTK